MQLKRSGPRAMSFSLLSFIVTSACASTPGRFGFVDDGGAGGAGDDASTATGMPPSDGGGAGFGGGFTFPDGGTPSPDSGASSGGPATAIGTVDAPDCRGCTFPPLGAAACSSAPPITIVYPSDRVLVPPNMGIISVQWKPAAAPFTKFEVDFDNPPNTAWRIVTTCGPTFQTTDMQAGGAPTGGCDLPIDGASWSVVADANRGGNPVSITIRGTTDGTCASTSTNTVHLSFAEQDLLGTYYYWKSTISSNGVGGQIWSKHFGDPTNPEKDVTSKAINATCNGCHSLSRDGSRMVVYSDDDDSDDEYSDIAGSELDMTTTPNATEFAGGVTAGGNGGGGQPPGFSTIDPLATFYITSNGHPCTGTGACSASTGYPVVVPSNGWSVWNATNGSFVSGATIGAAKTRPTMPDWSIDGQTIVYVVPAGVYSSWRNDDAHVYGGSLYTVPYAGGGAFGAPALLLQSGGENNYYPSFSPDATSAAPPSFVIFDRAPLDMSAGSVAGCTTGASPMCPNDSFSNPAARLMLMASTGAGTSPIDLEQANGSPASAPVPLSNSYPRWAPFVQTYKGNKLLWFTFSSTRDYGLRILNHKSGMYQCYPADSAETPGASHHAAFAPQCEEPQLWMAPLTFSENATTKDPSLPAFWIPYQDMTTHNHTAQWTEEATIPPPPTDAGCSCSMAGGACGAANSCGCCAGHSLICSGSDTCIAPAQ